jgi:hypothetical protein
MNNSNSAHYRILAKLFKGFSSNNEYKILDAGSGRTSLDFLTKKFPQSRIQAIVFPGDERKLSGIHQNVKATNFNLLEVDLYQFKQQNKFNIVLAHLLLGEATKFSKRSFSQMLKTLFNINTDYLIIIDILEDPDVDYDKLQKIIRKTRRLSKQVFEDKYVGYSITNN